MNIGQAASNSGLPAKTIRYYEDIGLITSSRTDNGYRDFSGPDVHRLKFLSRSRSLGFSIDECRVLLDLYADQSRASADVKRITKQHLDQIDLKVRELNTMRTTLSELIDRCHGDDRPDCPILEELAG